MSKKPAPENKQEIPRVAGGQIAKGTSGNPGGRPKKTAAERDAERYLRARTIGSAKRLVELTKHANKKLALRAIIAHLRITVGNLERIAPGGDPLDPRATMNVDELKALARAQLALERGAVKPGGGT